jgi:hypothetical protein
MFQFLRLRNPSKVGPAGRVPQRGTHPKPAPRTPLSVERLEDRTLLSAATHANPGDVLLIGDGTDNTVKQYDATTGAPEGNLVASGSQGLLGPRGLLFRNDGQLLAVNQNVGLTIPGEVLRYNGITGAPLGALVSATDAHAPYAPRGMVLGPNHTLYVADDGNLDGVILGRVARFNSETGAFLGDLQPTGFTGDFYARADVIGPDGLLYVTVRNIAPTGGEIMRWDPATGNFLGTFVASNAGNDLNRPEGIAFGPDGNLYVVSFRADARDTDKILEFNGQTGAYLDKIDLDQVGQPRAAPQALLFGPGGRLFVAITSGGPDTGAVRSYDVAAKTFTNFEAPGTLGQPWYLTFGNTDPGTLAYVEHPGRAAGQSSAPPVTPSGLQAVSAVANSLGLAGAAGSDPSAASGRGVATTSPFRNDLGSAPAAPAPPSAASTTALDHYFAHSHDQVPDADLLDDPTPGLAV